ncbi:MAG: segregation/condensation protein A [bacterium]|nr:segregation/condensation protein A [bacterium]
MVFHIKTQKFEGPLDMLLTMIEERKFSINEVSLAQIAGDYLVHIKELPDLPKREVSQFLVIAATLMLIKSRSLLPQLEMDKEEEADIAELQDRLHQLKIFRELARKLGKFALQRAQLYSRDTTYGFEMGFFPPEEFAFSNILEAAESIVLRLPKEDPLPQHVLEKIITLEEKIEELTQRIRNNPKVIFGALTDKQDKAEVIVSFLALLELFKDGIIFAEQKGLFHDIHIHHAKTSTDN